VGDLLLGKRGIEGGIERVVSSPNCELGDS